LWKHGGDYSEGRWWTAQIDVSRTFFEKHHMTIGTEERINTKQDQWNYDLQPYDPHLNDHRSSVVAAVYAQDEHRIRPDLILSAGLRYDHYPTFGGSFNPRLALIYRPWERTAFKLIYGQAFRAPNAFELYYSDQISEEGNPKLLPKSVKTTELIYEQYFLKRAHVGVSGFYNSSNNLINLVTNPVDNLLQFQNIENVIGKGIEFEVSGEWANGWKVRWADTIQGSYNS
jgi:outer membrane receptor for ferrienterochelin and colicins